MGADYIVIRGCKLQVRLGADGFAQTVKQRAQLTAILSRRAEIERRVGRRLEELRITFGGAVEPRSELTLAQLRERAASLDDTSQCPSCPVGGGVALGCYRFLSYPISVELERHFFAYFVDALGTGNPIYVVGHGADGRAHSAATLIRELMIHAGKPAGAAWREQRGSAQTGAVAELDTPLRATLGDGVELDSAQVLAAAFAPMLDGVPALTLYAQLFAGFVDYLDRHGIALEQAPSLREVTDLAALLTDAARAAKSESISLIVWS